MEAVVRLIIITALLMIIAAVGFFLITGRVGDLSDISNEQTSYSDCKIWQTQGAIDEGDRGSQCQDFAERLCSETETYDGSDPDGCVSS